MSVSSSSINSCSSWNLLERLIWKSACVSLFLSSPTLCLVRVLLTLVNLLKRSLTVIIRKWWSDDTSALIIRTSCHDLQNWMIFSLMSSFLVVNLAVMMQELTGSQPISAPCASGASITATPSVWRVGEVASSMCPEYGSCSPDELFREH